MWNLLIAFALVSTAATRLVSLYTGISALAYLALLPLFGLTVLAFFFVGRKHRILPIDLAMTTLVLLPIAWMLFGVIAANMTSVDYPYTQFFKQVIWSLLVFSPYFALRFAPAPNPNFVFWIFCLIVAAAIPVIYLQQVGILDQFYTERYEKLLSSYLDATGSRRFRNTGFFGYTHDAGQALLLFLIAVFSCIMFSNVRRIRQGAMIIMPLALMALVMTSSRTSLFQVALAVVSGMLFVNPFILNMRGGFLRNLVWFFGLSSALIATVWIVYTIQPDLFSTTILFTKGFLAPFTSEGRVGTTTTTITYLLSDPFRAFFGWGLGSGGLAVVQGKVILPVNAVDQAVTILLANFGILGLFIISGCLFYSFLSVARMHRRLVALARDGRFNSLLPVISYFCLMALWIGFLSSFTIGESVINRVYCNFAFLCLGALVNRYDLIVGRPAISAKARIYGLASRPA